ncbi:hypothetical protein IAD21_06413 (plasmid) [Abditibacteriota bacterium]|nr:hypothetical protein IAD21_06413 [Abditibacteriota bacterium]
MPNAAIYTVGGTVQAGHGIYIPRHADDELLDLCRKRIFAYVLTARQMGKSSLMVRTAQRLEQEGIQAVTIDLTQLGVQISVEQWYLGVLTIIEDQLRLETDVEKWWTKRYHLGVTHRLTQFFEQVLLVEVKKPVLIFVDEIDSTLGLDFTDDFYAAIRFLYNARARVPELGRLSFVLVGVATPSDLINDKERTPFNIGQGIRLEDFTPEEAQEFAAGLQNIGGNPAALLDAILAWTEGHPYMTQRLCNQLSHQCFQQETSEEERVRLIVEEIFLKRGRVDDVNLATTDKYFTATSEKSPWWISYRPQMLQLYRRLINGEQISIDNGDSVQRALRLTGIAAERRNKAGSYLGVRNQIFSMIFNRDWLKEKDSNNFLSESVAHWIDTGRRDDSLLRGKTLEDTWMWAERREGTTPLEREFLMASQRLERASQEVMARLFLSEQRRSRNLSLVNEVQKCALATRDNGAFLSQVTRAIGSHFADCDVSLYLSGRALSGLFGDEGSAVRFWDGDGDDMILIASAGDHNLGPMQLSRRSLGELRAGGAHPDARSHLNMPVLADGEGSGWLVIQTRDEGALDPRDEAALLTSTVIIALHLQNSRLFRSMSEVNDFNQSLLNSMLHSLMVVDRNGHIQFVNQRLLTTFGASRDDFRKQSLERVFGEGPARHHHLRAAIETVIETGEAHEVPEVHVWSPEGNKIFDVRLFRVYFRGQAEVAMLLINWTLRWRKTYQLQQIHEIGRLFQQSLDIERVLIAVLTCITAGAGLGFNRAFVFLLNETDKTLECRLALGPSSADEASRIWAEISQRELTVSDLIEETEREWAQGQRSPLQQRAMTLKITLHNLCLPAIEWAINGKTAVAVNQDELLAQSNSINPHPEEFLAASALFSAREIAIAPLWAKDHLVGVVLADNLYSGSRIDEGDVQLLDTVAQQAGMTINNALAYELLKGHRENRVY